MWLESARRKRIFLPVLSRSAPAHCGSNLHFYSPTAILNDDYSLKRTLKVKHVTPDGVVREPVTKPFCLPIAPVHSYTSFPLPLQRLTQLLVVLIQFEACRSGLLASLSHSPSFLPPPPSLPPLFGGQAVTTENELTGKNGKFDLKAKISGKYKHAATGFSVDKLQLKETGGL